jgi:hypothetical protein
MSAFEKVSSLNFLKLFLVKLVVEATIKVMNSGYTLIIDDELLLLLLLKLIILLESLRAIRLVLVHAKVLVAHLLDCLI